MINPKLLELAIEIDPTVKQLNSENLAYHLRRRLTWWVKKHQKLAEFIREFTSFLPDNASWTERTAYVLANKRELHCCAACGQRIEIKTSQHIDRRFCSPQCAGSAETTLKTRQNTLLKRYGVANSGQISGSRDRARATWLAKYGVDNPQRSEQIRRKTKQTNLEKYGSEHTGYAVSTIRAKIEATNQAKLGALAPFCASTVQAKARQSVRDKYGVENISQLPDIRHKIVQTVRNKYGVDNVSLHPDIRAKIEVTTELRYGVSRAARSAVISGKIRQSRLTAYYDGVIQSERFTAKVTPLFTRDEYHGVYYENLAYRKYPFRCVVCNHEFETNVGCGAIPSCPKCALSNKSRGELEIGDFLERLGLSIRRNARDILPSGLELDIYVPAFNLAVEYNGLYWHSELSGGKLKYYHQRKMLECKGLGIKLFSLFEDQWRDKSVLVKAMLKTRANIYSERVYARKCTVVTNFDAARFLNNSHLAGSIRGTALGLAHDNKLMSVLVMGKSRFSKCHDYEILRYASRRNCQVVGGLSKLISAFRREHSGSILTYADAAISHGNSYLQAGFTPLGLTTPGYYYLPKSYQWRESRHTYQKHKLSTILPNFNSELTEWQNMQEHGFDRIWDCGHWAFELPA